MIDKKLVTESVIAITIIALLLTQTAIGQFSITRYQLIHSNGAILPSIAETTFLISTDGTNYYAINETSGQISRSSTNAVTVINNALFSGGIVTISKGSYPIGQVTLSVTNTTLKFEQGAIFTDNNTGLVPFSSTANAINPAVTDTYSDAPLILISAPNCQVLGATILGNGQYNTFRRDGIMVYDTDNFLLSGCNVQNMSGLGILVRSSGTYNLASPTPSTLTCGNGVIQNCVINGTFSYPLNLPAVLADGIGIEFSHDVTVQNTQAINIMQSSFRTHYSFGITFDENLVTQNLSLNSTYTGEPFDIYRSSFVTAEYNNVYSPITTSGAFIYEYTNQINLIHDNFFTPFQQGCIRLQPFSGFASAYMSNINIQNCFINGILQVYANNVTNLNIVSNTIEGITPQSTEGDILLTNYGDVASPLAITSNINVDNNTFSNVNGYNVLVDGGFSADMNGNYMSGQVYLGNTSTLTINNNFFYADPNVASHALMIEGLHNGPITFNNNIVNGTGYQAVWTSRTGARSTILINNNEFTHCLMDIPSGSYYVIHFGENSGFTNDTITNNNISNLSVNATGSIRTAANATAIVTGNTVQGKIPISDDGNDSIIQNNVENGVLTP